MLRKLLRKRESVPDPDAPTYGEALLDAAIEHVPDTLRSGETGDAVEAIAAAMVNTETAQRDLPPVPTPPSAREQFIRTYATLVLDNDRSPPSCQMSGDDLAGPRALLKSFFTGSSTMQRDAMAVLRFVEQRFGEGRYSQARLLLKLFDTDGVTQRNNERNLFYEEMSARFLRPRVGDAPAPTFADDATLADVGRALDAFGVRLNTYGPDTRRVDAWREALEAAPPPERDAALRIIPGARWRPHWMWQDPDEAILRQFDTRGVRTFAFNLTLCVYFITLAPGSTGFESMVGRYVEWMGKHFPMVPTRILPRLHRDSMEGELGISAAFDGIWNSELAGGDVLSRTFGPNEIKAATDRVVESLKTGDLAGVPRGEYDLGGLVVGDLLGFDAGSIATALRMNRLA